jgi:hypothetical protein
LTGPVGNPITAFSLPGADKGLFWIKVGLTIAGFSGGGGENF